MSDRNRTPEYLETTSRRPAAATPIPSEVVMRRGGEVYRLKYYPGETLLETARRGGAPLNYNCERGECGTCMVTILCGAVRMRANEVLSNDDIKSGLALGCQSEPITDIIEIELP